MEMIVNVYILIDKAKWQGNRTEPWGYIGSVHFYKYNFNVQHSQYIMFF